MSGYDSSGMMVRQLFDRDSCTYTYLLVCKETNKAILIDPVDIMSSKDSIIYSFVVERDAEIIDQLGLRLLYGVNTHVHADHITGTAKLKEKFPDCKSVLSKVSGGQADVYFEDGDKIKFGKQELECRCTPGHTSGCTTYVSHAHKMAFTGDALLIRGCGRTDFQEGSPRTLYKSVHSKILSLPDDFKLFIGHDYKGRTVTSVSEEKKYNLRLTKNENEFVEIMNNLGLSYPKHIDRALPANLRDGITT